MITNNGYSFINHSKKTPNCKARVLLINCEHRIGFFALKDINAGTELFFNYGEEFNEDLVDEADDVRSADVKTKGKVLKNGKSRAVMQPRSVSHDDDDDDDNNNGKDDNRDDEDEER